MTNNQLDDERLVKILSETQATIMEHNSRCVRGSVEVDARLFESMIMELQVRRKAAMESEPVAIVEPSDYVTAAQLVGEGPARKAVHELYEGALRIGDKLYRHAQQPVVPPELTEDMEMEYFLRDDWKGTFRSGWEACRAAMLQAGNSPVIPAGLIAAVNRLLDSDGSRGCYSAIRCYEAREEVERLLATAPQEQKS